MDLEQQFEELGVTCPRCDGRLVFSPGKRVSFFRCVNGCSYRMTYKQAWGILAAEKHERELMRQMDMRHDADGHAE